MNNEHFIKMFYKSLNSNTNPTVDNVSGHSLIALNFTYLNVILQRLMKISISWYTRDFDIERNIQLINVKEKNNVIKTWHI